MLDFNNEHGKIFTRLKKRKIYVLVITDDPVIPIEKDIKKAILEEGGRFEVSSNDDNVYTNDTYFTDKKTFCKKKSIFSVIWCSNGTLAKSMAKSHNDERAKIYGWR